MSLKFEVITPVKNFVLSSNNKVLFIEGRNYIKRNNNAGKTVIEDAQGNQIILHNAVLVYTLSDGLRLKWETEPLFKILETMYAKRNRSLSLEKYKEESIVEVTDNDLKQFDIIPIPSIYFVQQ